MTRILLVRHGESTWNADGRWQGQADPPLSERGRQQAVDAASSIGTVDAIVTSDLERAAGTGAILSRILGQDRVATEPRLRERDAGSLSGRTRPEIWEAFPGLLPDDLWARVEVALLAIGRALPDSDVVAVTHGGVIYAVERHLGGPGRGRLTNLGGSRVEVDGDRITLGERVQLIDPADTLAIEADRI
jgi:broad specificity phosphatase PhoE